VRRLACWLALAFAFALPAGALDAPRLLDDETAVARVLATVDARLALMSQVAAAKWLAGNAVSDPAREQAVLEHNATAASALGLATTPAGELLALQMRFAREAQLRLHAKWQRHGCDACEPVPDLATVRQELDALGATQLRAIHLAAPALAAPDFVVRHTALADERLQIALPAGADRAALLHALAAIRRTAAPSLARVQASGVLRIATTGDYAPFSLERDGRLQGVILSVTDISDRKASEERIHYLATHDSLTGLANRASFLDQMDTSLLMARRQHSRFALLYLDLDHFKEVNDSLGHAAGDILLIETAQRMRQCLRASDLLARQGGDEFMALLHDVGGMNEALAVAEKIRRTINAPYVLDGKETLVSVSIGIALYPDHGTDLDSLTRRADAAMYRTKSIGRNGASAAVTRRTPP